MTILQALKKIKHLDRKIEKSKTRTARWCSYFDDEEPVYDEAGIRKLMQSIDDLIRERNRLRHLIHKTNILTTVTFEHKEFTIDELLILRTLTLPALKDSFLKLRRKEKSFHHDKDVKVVVQYDPNKRDKTVDSIENTMDELDALLDQINITTELVE